MELRQNHRYRLTAQVGFTCEYANGDIQEGNGLTRDISKSGIFILSSAAPPLDAAVLFRVILPLPESPGTKLRGHGHVVRVEGEGFAVNADVAFRMQAEKHTRRRTSPKEEHAAAENSKQEAVSASDLKPKYLLHLQ